MHTDMQLCLVPHQSFLICLPHPTQCSVNLSLSNSYLSLAYFSRQLTKSGTLKYILVHCTIIIG